MSNTFQSRGYDIYRGGIEGYEGKVMEKYDDIPLDSNAGYQRLLTCILLLGRLTSDQILFRHWTDHRHPEIHKKMQQFSQALETNVFINDYGASLVESVMNISPRGPVEETFEAAVDFMEELFSQTKHFYEYEDKKEDGGEDEDR